MKSIREIISGKPWFGWVLFLTTLVVVFLLGLLASAIMERRAEAVFAYRPVIEYGQHEPRSDVWGANFPTEYHSYLQTADTGFESKYNGSVFIDMLERDPRMVVLWAGYGFSKDYSQSRGHQYAVEDIRETLRTGGPMEGEDSPMPNTCWTCKSPDVPRVMDVSGIAGFYEGSWEEKGHEIVNTIGCADCHDAETMNLRISRPALIEALERRGVDVEESSHQEMRSLVCAQCHVEYYFNENIVEGVPYLVYPWDRGLHADSAQAYYDAMGFADWTHALSRAPMLKAQHPDYEIYLTGTHASRGVSCADCHMPYQSAGGRKYTSHHVQSPLNNINASCQVCHRDETERLVKDVYSRQDKIIENRNKLEKLLVRAHVEAKKAWDLGAGEIEMEPVLQYIRQSQWRWDYAAAGHGNSFHSPVETSRIIADGIARAQEARVMLARILAAAGYGEEVPYPDISTKAKAQAFIGLDMERLNQEKEEFLETVVPEWDRIAAEREATYPVQLPD